MRAGLSPRINFSQVVQSAITIPVGAPYAERADVVVNLAQTIDPAKSWVEIISNCQPDPPYEAGYAFEAVLSPTQLTWKWGSSNNAGSTRNTAFIGIVRELLHPPKSLQIVTSGGGLVSLAQAVDPKKAFAFNSGGMAQYNIGTGVLFADHCYLSSGSQIYYSQTLHPRATVVEFY